MGLGQGVTDLAGLIITMQDVKEAGHCASGCRRWFHAHGLDFRAFMRGGIDAKTFLEKGDGLAQQVVDRTIARREAADLD